MTNKIVLLLGCVACAGNRFRPSPSNGRLPRNFDVSGRVARKALATFLFVNGPRHPGYRGDPGTQARPDIKRSSEMEATNFFDDYDGLPGHRWLLLRHGQTNFNKEGVVQGSSDVSRLSELGREQAQLVGEWLKAKKIDKVYVSPLTRAQETLEHAEDISGTKLMDRKVVLPDLREVDLHEWEGACKKMIKEEYPDLYKKYRGDNAAEFRLPSSGKYPIRDLWVRANGVWQHVHFEAARELAAKPKLETALPGGVMLGKKDEVKNSLVTAHNGINQAMLATALGIKEEAYRKFEFPNCGIAEVLWEPGEENANLWRWVYPTPSKWQSAEETRWRVKKDLPPMKDIR